MFGHENLGVIESVGDAVRTVQPGDRVVLPFNASLRPGAGAKMPGVMFAIDAVGYEAWDRSILGESQDPSRSSMMPFGSRALRGISPSSVSIFPRTRMAWTKAPSADGFPSISVTRGTRAYLSRWARRR